MKPLVITGALALTVTPALFRTEQKVQNEARGKTVYVHAWGGDQRTNDFIASVGQDVQQEHGVTVQHVRLADTADAVARVLAERAAAPDTDG